MAKLSEQTPANGLPPAIAYDVANAAARNALAPTAPSVGKLLLQRDIKRIFALVAAGPAEWIQLVEQAALNTLADWVATKADANATATALSGKASTTDLTNGLASKADATATTNALATKADATATTNALAGKADLALTINPQTGATFTLTANAPKEWLLLNRATAQVLTVPPNSTIPIGTGIPCTVSRHGAGTVTITAGAGVTLLPANNMVIDVQYGMATLTKSGTDEWYVTGQVS